MNKEKTLFLAGALFVQLGAVAIHWGLALALFGVWCLILSYAEHEEKEVSDATASQQLSAGQGMDFRAAEPPEKKTHQQLLHDYKELLATYGHLQEKANMLISENKELIGTNIDLQKQNGEFRAEIADLSERIEKLTSEPKSNTD